ncbi:MAG: hypothetical protein GEV28_18575 [Actinophytocola sp.]|uniref:hypothetical protein n=1 Tax=Actinophytocola sp. TaxID=1872138 RepID=UPI001321F125|nr:hypothetical protein [Actinophytocola sp.]MPZ82289.1 hypothetical protein [Actinophytocola sp.]
MMVKRGPRLVATPEATLLLENKNAGPAHDRPVLGRDRDPDRHTRPDGGRAGRRDGTGLGRHRGVPPSLAAELGPAGIRVVCPRSHAIPETPLIEESFAMIAPAAGVTPPSSGQSSSRARCSSGSRPSPTPPTPRPFIASDRAGAMTATVANLSAGSINH